MNITYLCGPVGCGWEADLGNPYRTLSAGAFKGHPTMQGQSQVRPLSLEAMFVKMLQVRRMLSQDLNKEIRGDRGKALAQKSAGSSSSASWATHSFL